MPTPDPHTQSEVSSHKLNPGPALVASMRDLEQRLENGTVGELKQTTHAVPTTEAQAKELTQKYGVWRDYYGHGFWMQNHGKQAHEKGEVDGFLKACWKYAQPGETFEVRPYPSTTPPPTPPASSGGEWTTTMIRDFTYLVKPDGHIANAIDMVRAAQRLNAADAMEQAVKFAIAMLDHDMPPSNITAVRERLLEAALRK